MKKRKIFLVFSILWLSVVCFSCKNKPEPVSEDDSKAIEENSPYRYIYVLNEGLWGNNDASLDRISLQCGKIEKNIFATINGYNLGDVANDMIIYGEKLYIAVNNSNTIEVLSPSTAQSIQRISLNDKFPRYIIAHEGFVYVSCYSDEIIKIDTSTLSISDVCSVGKDPECLDIVNQKLYVANSGGLDFPNYDSTISVIDISNFSEEKKITIGLNPTKLAVIDEYRLLVLCNGNYENIPAFLAVLNLNNETITKLPFSCSNFVVHYNYAYCYHYDWNSNEMIFFKINLNSLEKEHLILEKNQTIISPYGIAVNKSNNNIYISDCQNFQSNGDFLCFSPNGNFKYKKECGIGPSKIVFY